MKCAVSKQGISNKPWRGCVSHAHNIMSLLTQSWSLVSSIEDVEAHTHTRMHAHTHTHLRTSYCIKIKWLPHSKSHSSTCEVCVCTYFLHVWGGDVSRLKFIKTATYTSHVISLKAFFIRLGTTHTHTHMHPPTHTLLDTTAVCLYALIFHVYLLTLLKKRNLCDGTVDAWVRVFVFVWVIYMLMNLEGHVEW